VLLPDDAALTRALDRVDAAGIELQRPDGDAAARDSPAPGLVRDPFGIAVALRRA
jgi:hypothetical protein